MEVGGDVAVVERVAVMEPQGWTLGAAQLPTERLCHVHGCQVHLVKEHAQINFWTFQVAFHHPVRVKSYSKTIKVISKSYLGFDLWTIKS